jgi:hypothetical protein
MKKPAILILLCAVALPASVGAQTPVAPLKWSLKLPQGKAKTIQAKSPEVQGPAVPPPQRLRTPRAAPKAVARRSTIARPNNTPLVSTVNRLKRN